MIKERLYFFSICLHFAVVCLFYSYFCFEKLLSDMVPTFQSDHVVKMYFEIVFNKCLHHIEIFGPCQTLWIFLICFLLLHGVMAPKNIFPWRIPKMKRLEIEVFKNLYLNVFLTNPLMEFLQFTIIRQISTI